MGPVSFARFSFASRQEALEAARLLADAGLRPQAVDGGSTILVRNDDLARAEAVLGPGPHARADRDAAADLVAIEPLTAPVDAVVEIPGSKSHANRALLCAALSSGRSTLTRVLQADDTDAMLGALRALGVGIEVIEEGPAGASLAVEGVGPAGFSTSNSESIRLDVRQSGTTGRFLLPVLATSTGRFVLDGDPQLRARPFGPQLDALRSMGAVIDGGRMPMSIAGRQLQGGELVVSGSLSSQFLSGLMLAGPLHLDSTTIRVDGQLVSRPYVELTMHTMASFGVDVEHDDAAGTFTIPSGGYRPAVVDLEPDASAASYFFAAAAMTGGKVRVEGLGRSTVQGDLGFVRLLEQMGALVQIADDFTEVRGGGVLRGISVDMSDVSDTVQTLAMVAVCAETPTEITGVGFIRHKETDRIMAVVTELVKLGIEAEETDDGLRIIPGVPRGGVVDTYDDHRMAMSFSLLGLRFPAITIANPGCVSKTFPRFFTVLESLRR